MNISFYHAVLPPEGLYCALSIKNGTVVPSFHPTIQDLVDRGNVLHAQDTNVFFALAAYTDAAEGRKAANAKALRCLFVDIDCGAGKPYEDQAEGAAALRAFIATTGLPTPYIVNSGRGLHVYWPFHEVLTTATWKPLARAFKQLCAEHKLAIDLSVTADPARVLRMVDTANHKVTPAVPVLLMVEGVVSDLATLKALMPPIVEEIDWSAAKGEGVDAMTRALAGGDYPASEFSRIVRRSLRGTGCAQISNAVQNSATLEEPLWRAALSIAWRCTDAETSIHTLSRGHPGYTAEGTLQKAEGTQGPMTCEWYRSNYSAGCAGCTQRITSPIALGRKVEAAEAINDVYIVEQQLNPDNAEIGADTKVQVEIPAYPFPYFRGLHGGVYLKSKDKESGDPIEVEIYKYDLYLSSRFYDSSEQGDGEGELVGVNLHTPHDGIRRFIAPVAHLLTKEKMRDLLLKHGVVAINKELDNIMAYLAASIRNLQKSFASDRTRNQMGWTPDDSGFVVGELEYTAHGIRLAPAASATKAMAPKLMAKGTLAKWSTIANFYDRPGMEAHALSLAFGFGAPLLRLIGGMEVRGAAINLMSNKSGTGKTTAQMVINSIFGHPSELLMKKTDTGVSKMQWLGTLNSMAATMDEVTNYGDEELSELIYDIPQGRGKNRMESQTNKLRVNNTSWMTFVIMSSNSSLYDKLTRLKNTSDGELRRLIELRVNRPADISKQESDLIFGALADNYGVAGPVFIQYVMQNREKVIAQLKKIQSRIDNDLSLTQADRFYSIVLACAFTGISIAVKLGLCAISISRVYTYALHVITDIRADIIAPAADNTLAAQETLTTYVNENLNNALVINGARTLGNLSAPTQSPRGPLRIRYEPDTRELWIPAAALKDYFVSRQVDFQQAIRELADRKVLKNGGAAMTKRIGAGAIGSFDAMGIRCYCIDGIAVGLTDTTFAVDNGAALSNP